MDRKEILSLETGVVHPHRREGEVSVCLVYPNSYEVGMANLGFQLVYKLLNQIEGITCERAFIDIKPMKSLESRKKLSQFHIVAFSLSYELDFLNILKILRATNIRPYSKDRAGCPILILGGVAAFANPLPYSPFFDLICIGEAEKAVHELIKLFRKNPQDQAFLKHASEIEGVWVPVFGEKGVRRTLVQNLNEINTCAACVSPLTHFKNMLLVEVERGCPFDCRFCLAKQAYSPYRVKNSNRIVQEIVRSRIKAKSIGLIGTAISEVPNLTQLIKKLSTLTESIGISSLRLDRVDIELLSTLLKTGLKTVTIAPEAGTEKLRQIINKRIKDEEILRLAATADSLKVRRIKLYFMVGLPFEREEDLVGMVDLVRKFRKIYKGELVISINPFVPKAHTPFQYHRMENKRVLSNKISLVTKELRKMGRTKVIRKSPKEALLQAILSLGDSSVGKVLLRMVDDSVGWESAFKEAQIDLDKYLSEKSTDSKLPWEFIDFGVDAKSLGKSYNEAKRLSQKS